MLLSHSLMEYLKKEAVEHGKVVADFTHSLAVYEDFKPDQVEDEKTGLAYSKAVESMKEWLRKAMLLYMAEAHTYTQSSVNLILPSGELSLEVLADTAKSQQYGGYYEEAEIVMTPIGYMNYAVYSFIRDVKDNPVRMFYRKYDLSLADIEGFVKKHPDGCHDYRIMDEYVKNLAESRQRTQSQTSQQNRSNIVQQRNQTMQRNNASPMDGIGNGSTLLRDNLGIVIMIVLFIVLKFFMSFGWVVSIILSFIVGALIDNYVRGKRK